MGTLKGEFLGKFKTIKIGINYKKLIFLRGILEVMKYNNFE